MMTTWSFYLHLPNNSDEKHFCLIMGHIWPSSWVTPSDLHSEIISDGFGESQGMSGIEPRLTSAKQLTYCTIALTSYWKLLHMAFVYMYITQTVLFTFITPRVHKAYSWVCTQWSLLTVLWRPYAMPVIKQGSAKFKTNAFPTLLYLFLPNVINF